MEIHVVKFDNLYDVTITWSRPDFEPDNYLINLTSVNKTDLFLNVPGSKNFAKFINVELGPINFVSVTANSTGGSSESFQFMTTQTEHKQIKGNLWVVLTITFCAIFILAIICVAIFIYYKRVRYAKYQRRCKYFEVMFSKRDV